jgi:hypothetical protein
MLKIDSAASSGDQGKLTYTYFYFPPLEAALSTSMLCFFFTCARKLFFLIYTCQEAIVFYSHVAYEPLICERNDPA